MSRKHKSSPRTASATQHIEKISREVKLLLSRGTVGPSLGSSRSFNQCKPHLGPWENSLKHLVLPPNDCVAATLFEVTIEVALGTQDKGPGRYICTGLRGKER